MVLLPIRTSASAKVWIFKASIEVFHWSGDFVSFETRWTVPRHKTPSPVVYSAPDHFAKKVFLSGFESGQCVLVLSSMQPRSRQSLLLDTVACQVAAHGSHSPTLQLAIDRCTVMVVPFSLNCLERSYVIYTRTFRPSRQCHILGRVCT